MNNKYKIKINKRIILYLLLLFIPSAIIAQDLIEAKGKVLDLEKNPLENLEVRITNLNQEIKQTYTDENGFYYFYLLPDTYTLQVLSFENIIYIESIDLKESTVLEDIKVESDIRLEGVVLVAKKPILNTTAGGFKLNVIGTNLEHKGNALDVLKYAPNVSIRNGLEILGSNSYKIIFNNKELHLTEAQKTLFLKNLKSHTIQSIEIIDRPDASMDSDVHAVIKIESNNPKGIAGGIASYVFYDRYFGNSINLDFTYTSNKLTFYSNFYNSFHKSNLLTTETNELPDYTYNIHRNNKVDREERNIVLGGDYYLDASKTIGFFYNYTKDNDNNFSSLSNYKINTSLDSNLKEIVIANELENKGTDHTLMLDYNQKLDSLGSSLSGSLNYFFNTYKTPFYQKYEKINLTETLIERNQQNTDDKKNMYALKVDWDKKYKNNSNLKTGVKYLYNKNIDSFFYYEEQNNELILNDLFSNRFNYKENNASFYTSYSFRIKKSSFMLGSRLEYKDFDFNINENLEVDNVFLNILPSVYYGYDSFYFYFTKSLNYTNYYLYNPSIKKINELEYSSGNKDLNPIKTYIFQLGYTFRNKYSATLQYGYSDNYIYTLKSNYTDGTTLSAPVNGGYLNYTRLYLSAPITFFDWWQSTNKINLGYNDFKVPQISNKSYNGWNIGFDSYHDFSLPSDIELSLGFGYNSGSTFLYMKNKESFSTELELSFPIFKNAFLDFSVDDIFNTEKEGYSYDFNGLRIHSVTKPHTGRTFLIGFRYHFSKGKEVHVNYKESDIQSEKDKVKK